MTPSKPDAETAESSVLEDPETEATGGVEILVWPAEAHRLKELADGRTPRLVLVEDGSEPPVGAECCQDWMWQTGDAREFRLRLRQVALRALGHGAARPYVDAIGMLHVGLRSVHLRGKEQRLAALLIEHFNERVAAADLLAAGWRERQPSLGILSSRISGLRRRVGAVGLELPGSLRNGYVLRPRGVVDAGSAEASAEVSAFDAEVDTQRWLPPRREHPLREGAQDRR